MASEDTDRRLEGMVGAVARERRASMVLLVLYRDKKLDTPEAQAASREGLMARADLVDLVEGFLVEDLELVPRAWWRQVDAAEGGGE